MKKLKKMGNTDQKSEGEYFVSLHYDILNNFDGR